MRLISIVLFIFMAAQFAFAQDLNTIKLYRLKTCKMVYEVKIMDEKEIDLENGSYFLSRLLASGKEVYQDIVFDVVEMILLINTNL